MSRMAAVRTQSIAASYFPISSKSRCSLQQAHFEESIWLLCLDRSSHARGKGVDSISSKVGHRSIVSGSQTESFVRYVAMPGEERIRLGRLPATYSCDIASNSTRDLGYERRSHDRRDGKKDQDSSTGSIYCCSSITACWGASRTSQKQEKP